MVVVAALSRGVAAALDGPAPGALGRLDDGSDDGALPAAAAVGSDAGALLAAAAVGSDDGALTAAAAVGRAPLAPGEVVASGADDGIDSFDDRAGARTRPSGPESCTGSVVSTRRSGPTGEGFAPSSGSLGWPGASATARLDGATVTVVPGLVVQ